MTKGSFRFNCELRQLIVIGNGFDLECGLKSKFDDFYEPRKAFLHPGKSAPASEEPNSYDSALERGITVWDVILEEYSGDLWNDIEKAIEVWIVPDSDDDEGAECSNFRKLLGLLGSSEAVPPHPLVDQGFLLEVRVGEWGDDPKLRAVADFINGTNKQPSGYWNVRRLYDYLYEQLRLLEEQFREYLNAQVSGSEGYCRDAWSLMSDLLAQDPCEGGRQVLTTVLNFNYTNPIRNKPSGIPLVSVNVHGSLDGEIVFGIDGKDHLGNDQVAPFTKTYRLLGLHSRNRLTIFDGMGAGAGDRSVDVIKFYGHSLSKPDYSYFQAIFDEVDLYSSNTRLIFYYRNHSGKKDSRAKTSRAVSRLLSEYGRTMDNKDHGKNLMHKLILEGRLSVLELEKAAPDVE